MKKLFIDELLVAPQIKGINAETHNLIDLKRCRVFLLQNILSTIPDEIDFSQLPRLAPPYENCWFEWTKNIIKRDDIPEDFSGDIDDHMLDMMLNLDGECRQGISLSSNHINEEGWHLYFESYIRVGENIPLIFPILYKVELNSDGYFIKINKLIKGKPNPMLNSLASNLLEDDAIQESVNTVLYALGLMNCKNIVTIERGGPRGESKRNRHHAWLHRHYVLQIHPMKEITKIEHDDGSSEREISFHFCRGHFKTYTVEKPLFGKFVGTFWWDAHARGSIKTGIVTKDYNVNPPTTI